MRFSELRNSLLDYWRGGRGTTAIEYALMAAGIALAIVAAVLLMGDEVLGLYEDVQTGLAAQL